MRATNGNSSGLHRLETAFDDRTLSDVGDKITARFDVTFNNTPPNNDDGGLRWGVWDNGGSDLGYYAEVDLGTAMGNGLTLIEDTSAGSALEGGNNLNSIASFSINDTALHTCTIVIERVSSTEIMLTASVDGTNVTTTDSATLRTTFDGFGIRLSDKNSIDLDNILLTDCQGVEVTLTITNNPIVAPSNQTATADGAEAIDLSWARNGTPDNVLILRSVGAVPDTSPTLGTGYTVGETIGNAAVIFNGLDTAFKGVELTPGTTNYYRFYSVTASTNFSPFVAANAVTETYDTEIVDPFSYTLSDNLNSKNGGNGFSGAWTSGGNPLAVATSRFSDISCYPGIHGHSVCGDPPANSVTFGYRDIAAATSGALFVSFMIHYGSEGKISMPASVTLTGVRKRFSSVKSGAAAIVLGLKKPGAAIKINWPPAP